MGTFNLFARTDDGSLQMVELNVLKMTCGGCIASVTRAVRALDPAAQVRVDLASSRVRIAGARGAQDYARAITAAGYPASADGDRESTPKRQGSCCS